jgi:hypothetical protein
MSARPRARSPLGCTRMLASAILALALVVPATARADAGRKLYDAVVLRPLGFVQVVVGAVLFPVFYAGSLVTGGSETVTKVCIGGPVEQTFRKDLGDF